MGKSSGFLEYERVERPSVPESERILNFNEFHVDTSIDERRRQGARCMNCGVPFCQSAIELGGMVTGCPLHNLIPEWNDEIYMGNECGALERLLSTSSFPEFTGRVCPALCEKACVAGLNGEPVTVRENELYIIETAFKNGMMTPRAPKRRTGRRVAVVGSGPSGLAAADRLNRYGHTVTVFEKSDRAGGLLMYGIPNMKLEKQIVDRRVSLMESEGVRFELNSDVGRDVSADGLMSDFDAVVLCCGSKVPRSLDAASCDVGGVYYAVDFLTSVTKALDGGVLSDREHISAKDKNVVIVGGGDTGNDCVATCIRLGCRSVVQLEMTKEPPKDRSEKDTWPRWPRVLKTDYGQEEASYLSGHDPRIYETTVKEIKVNDDGALSKVVTVNVSFESGKLTEKAGSEKVLDADMMIIAAGFVGCESYVTDAFGVERSSRGRAVTEDGKYQTAKEGVFAAGDMRRGQSLVVWAISEGRHCADEVNEYLLSHRFE